MWAIVNYYKDQEEDIEKYKLICKFANPEMANMIWGDGKSSNEDDSYAEYDNELLYEEIAKHSKAKLSPQELKKRIDNPEDYDDGDLDTIERVK